MLKKAKKFNKNMTVEDIKSWYYENDHHYKLKKDNNKFHMLDELEKTTEEILEKDLDISDYDFEQMAKSLDKLKMMKENRKLK